MGNRNTESFRRALRERVLIFDGAMGTLIQGYALTPADYGGYDGCNEMLAIQRPDVISAIHAAYLDAGCDAVETDSFGANRVVLAEYGLADRAYELNRRAAALAREIADSYATPDRPRFVIGSMGPGTKLPTLGHIDFDTLRAVYHEQAAGLVDGGADVLLIETCQDILQVKAAVVGALEYRQDVGKDFALMVQVTLEDNGTMLLGTEIGAALTAMAGYPLDAFGINCATGPDRMAEHIRYLAENSPFPISCLPNAGLPENVDGKTVYPLTPAELAEWHRRFVTEYGVRIVGGCCGTTPAHLCAVAEAVHGCVGSVGSKQTSQTPHTPHTQELAACSSLYASVPLRQQPAPTLIGERSNAIGSRKFRQLLESEDWDAMVAVGRDQVRQGGAHAVDICVADVGRDEARDMREAVSRFVQQVPAPLVVDSTDPTTLEAALKLIGGKAIINSVNLEEGEERAGRVLALAKQYNAAVIAMTIDEEGMAKQAAKKVAIAERLYRLATEQYGIPGHDIIFDTITFTLATGEEESRRAALETMQAIREIKARMPEVQCVLGVSNVSFGLKPAARHVLNSVFLHYAISYGLDMAIVDAARIQPLYRIPEQERELARRILFDERRPGSDPLAEFIALFTDADAPEKKAAAAPRSLEERLKARIIDGERPGLEALLDEALEQYPPLRIINEILLEGMRVVGELFGSGQMQLPFVLHSAEVMKAAVSYLEPRLDRDQAASKGTLVLATVKGDVHDIGKNLVEIILSNNGYRVINLGIKQPIANIIAAAREHHADAIGMSGLLVKSTVVMKENLEALNAAGISLPVLLGGAALTRRYVEEDLRACYGGPVHYCQDAFAGLRVMDAIHEGAEAPAAKQPAAGAAPKRSAAVTRPSLAYPPAPQPPFRGSRVVKEIPLAEVFSYLNEDVLFRGRWQFRRQNAASDAAYEQLLAETVRPLLARLKRQCLEESLLQPRVVYGYFPCNAAGDDLIVWEEDGKTERLRFHFPRQREGQGLCVADFWRPVEEGTDLLPCMLVTIGEAAGARAQELYQNDRYADYLYLHGLSVETAEALAEYWHRHIRQELGIAAADAAAPRELFTGKYQGCRYAFGYPACPDLADQEKLFALLQPERIGVSLSETHQLLPEQSASSIISYHPEARYLA